MRLNVTVFLLEVEQRSCKEYLEEELIVQWCILHGEGFQSTLEVLKDCHIDLVIMQLFF